MGRDTRVSGEMLESALIAGLISIGAEVMRLGIISTPGVAYLTKRNGSCFRCYDFSFSQPSCR